MNDLIWTFIFLQTAMGGFDTLYHHELTERLAWRPSQKNELLLHGVRNLAYAVMFAAFGWTVLHGAAAMALIALMIAELIVTLWDFVEEDRTRQLPATERVLHALLTLNYGVILTLLVPILLDGAAQPTDVSPAYHGVWSWLCGIAAIGVAASGARDLAAASRTMRIGAGNPVSLADALPGRLAILITGGTGFIGSRLAVALIESGHEVTVLTRSRARAVHLPAPLRVVTSLHQISDDERYDAIVNLAGEPISDGLWTVRKRRRILRSRIRTTQAIVKLIGRLHVRPAVLVSGSAIGWYGLRDDEILDEDSNGFDCFSRALCVRWEAAATPATELSVRVVLLRTGLALAADGGMLSRMLTPFEFGLGGRLGSGCQWMSWIHRDDLVRLIVHAIATPSLNGPLNATAPMPVTNSGFTRALGRALRRPAVLPVPAAPLRMALGAFADELLLRGQRVIPRAALDSGFRFYYPRIDIALAAIVGSSRGMVNEPGPNDGGIQSQTNERTGCVPDPRVGLYSRSSGA